MGKFQFADNVVNLDFDGVKLQLSYDQTTTDLLQKKGLEMADFAKDMETAADVDKAVDLMLDILDDVLGDGAADAIFAHREPSLYDCLDVFKYIMDEVASYNNARVEKFQGTAPQNRTQRRARK